MKSINFKPTVLVALFILTAFNFIIAEPQPHFISPQQDFCYGEGCDEDAQEWCDDWCRYWNSECDFVICHHSYCCGSPSNPDLCCMIYWVFCTDPQLWTKVLISGDDWNCIYK